MRNQGSCDRRRLRERNQRPPTAVALPYDIYLTSMGALSAHHLHALQASIYPCVGLTCQDNTDALSGDDEMVVVSRVVLLIAGSTNKTGHDGASASSEAASSARTGGGEDGKGGSENPGIEHGDIMQALSGAHLREVGIAIKEARPGWQEAHVQVGGGRTVLLLFFGLFLLGAPALAALLFVRKNAPVSSRRCFLSSPSPRPNFVASSGASLVCGARSHATREMYTCACECSRLIFISSRL